MMVYSPLSVLLEPAGVCASHRVTHLGVSIQGLAVTTSAPADLTALLAARTHLSAPRLSLPGLGSPGRGTEPWHLFTWAPVC